MSTSNTIDVDLTKRTISDRLDAASELDDAAEILGDADGRLMVTGDIWIEPDAWGVTIRPECPLNIGSVVTRHRLTEREAERIRKRFEHYLDGKHLETRTRRIDHAGGCDEVTTVRVIAA